MVADFLVGLLALFMTAVLVVLPAYGLVYWLGWWVLSLPVWFVLVMWLGAWVRTLGVSDGEV